mmetsp:Transcript_1067/g.3317  ORF Transcript_1067/g.3317 Transcript_1067/m.3317 type:complete len:221 (-) Transcript_1067:1331-1993(-)
MSVGCTASGSRDFQLRGSLTRTRQQRPRPRRGPQGSSRPPRLRNSRRCLYTPARNQTEAIRPRRGQRQVATRPSRRSDPSRPPRNSPETASLPSRTHLCIQSSSAPAMSRSPSSLGTREPRSRVRMADTETMPGLRSSRESRRSTSLGPEPCRLSKGGRAVQSRWGAAADPGRFWALSIHTTCPSCWSRCYTACSARRSRRACREGGARTWRSPGERSGW